MAFTRRKPVKNANNCSVIVIVSNQLGHLLDNISQTKTTYILLDFYWVFCPQLLIGCSSPLQENIDE